MSAKRVFILGAGFSKQAGMPLATELTPLLIEKFKEYDQEEALSWFEELNETMNWLEGSGGGKSTKINIEEVFDLAYFDTLRWCMEQHRCPLGRMDGETPWNRAESIEAWLSHMEYDLIDVIWEEQEAALEKMEGIQRFTQNLRQEDVILTFNYDTLIEKSLTEFTMPWSYGFRQEKREGTVILKMHGSINWRIAKRGTSESRALLFRKEDRNVTKQDTSPADEHEWKYELARVSDDEVEGFVNNRDLQWSETFYYVGIAGLGAHKRLSLLPGSGEVWHNAGRALLSADEVCVVGFSLSPFDNMARLCFAEVMLARAKKGWSPPKVTIVDPCARELTDNFLGVFGADTAIKTLQRPAEETDWAAIFAD